MRRYLTPGKIKGAEITKTDVLIIGTGIAGLFAALNLDPKINCTVITKTNIENGNSWLAQGGIAAVISPDDNFESHIEDTLTAGAGLCNVEAVKILVSESTAAINELIKLGVPFDTNYDGDLEITREGGHSRRRIVHCGGDATGRETTRRLGQIVLQKKNLSFMFDTFLIDIITINNEAVGALVFDGKFKIIFAKKTIIATGGIGHIYKYTTNPRGAVGDGIAAALRAGAHDSMMEMIQFHPTTLITGGIEHDRLFLISEAVRGEGGILRNSEGVRFAEGKHPLNELAPRDIVTRIILDELKRSGDDRVYLDVRSMTRKFFLQRFPNIFAKCRDNGINLTDDFIPIRPAQHFLMGGIETDIDAKTAVANLYACGEAACTGIHGANRLASNSMLECLVFGNRAAQDISGNNFGTPSPDISQIDILDIKKEGEKPEGYSAAAHKHKLREIMSKYAGAVRKISELHEAKAFAENLLNLLESISLTDIADFELYSMTQTALCVINAALARKVSVGAHFVN